MTDELRKRAEKLLPLYPIEVSEFGPNARITDAQYEEKTLCNQERIKCREILEQALKDVTREGESKGISEAMKIVEGHCNCVQGSGKYCVADKIWEQLREKWFEYNQDK